VSTTACRHGPRWKEREYGDPGLERPGDGTAIA
jgi:hypothetical protein